MFKTQGAQDERLVQKMQNELTDFENEISNMSKDDKSYEILRTRFKNINSKTNA